MDTQIGKLIFFAFLIFLFGCSNPDIKKIESLTGLRINKQISKQDEIHQWNDFNGNGHKIIVYKINDKYIKEVYDSLSNRGFQPYTQNKDKSGEVFSNSEIAPYIKNSNGLFKTEWIEDEITTIVIDSTNSKLIYYYSVL